MSEELKTILISRFKSFLWRLLGYAIALFFAFILDLCKVIELSPAVITIITLAIGEITKYLNVNLPDLKKLEDKK